MPGPSSRRVVASGTAGTTGSSSFTDGLYSSLNNEQFGISGYEFTGGFTDRTTGQSGANDLGSNVEYTSDLVDARRWYRFGITDTDQATRDSPYWTDPTPSPSAGVGLFGGAYMPYSVSSLFSFTDNTVYNNALETGDLQYTAATGSFDFSQCEPGDFLLCRFDFNVVPLVANSTLEVGLIWSTRAANDAITFTFPLTTQPITFGPGSVGQAFLARPLITAYFASQEDVNARALPAIRGDNQFLIQPLTTLITILR
jgi:hypothetical protein